MQVYEHFQVLYSSTWSSIPLTRSSSALSSVTQCAQSARMHLSDLALHADNPPLAPIRSHSHVYGLGRQITVGQVREGLNEAVRVERVWNNQKPTESSRAGRWKHSTISPKVVGKRALHACSSSRKAPGTLLSIVMTSLLRSTRIFPVVYMVPVILQVKTIICRMMYDSIIVP